MITGSSGNLGIELLKIDDKIIGPKRLDFDILNKDQMKNFFEKNNISKVIHCAALTDTSKCEKDIVSCIDTNIIGTLNLIKMQQIFNFKIIYISTDYVFSGSKGEYKPDDPINPISAYSKSKASAELAVRMNHNNLVIRTSFFPLKFKHSAAFVDQYTTKDFVDVIAPLVYKESISEKTGVVHVGVDKDSVYNKVKKRYPNIKKMSRKDITSVYIPKDTSLLK
jgi:dTDP-4-dehydrorhamnose reductase